MNWIKIGDMPQSGNIVRSVSEKITPEGAKKSRKVDIGDIILSNSMSFGKPYIMGIPGYIHDGWFVIREYEKTLYKDYLCQLLSSDYVQKQYHRMAAGGVVLNISSDLVNSVVVPVPDLDEQQKIADFLSLVDERIEKQRQLVEVLKRYKRGLFYSIYSAKQLKWKSVCIGDFSKVYGGYAFDSKTYSESGKYRVLTIGSVSGNRYADIDSCNMVDEIPSDIQRYQILRPNDLVISMTGNVGRVSIVNQLDCLLNQRVAKLDITDSTIREYVYQVLSCSNFEQEMNNVGQGAAQKNIKNTDIEHFGFYIPNNETELLTVVGLLWGIDNTILKQEQILTELANSKQALLQQMFI